MSDPVFVFLTGASGAGKTHLTKALEAKLDKNTSVVAYFDTIGVPTPEMMIQKWGSAEKWQEEATHLWIKKLSDHKDKNLIVLEGQYNPQFAIDACKKFGISKYMLEHF